MRRRGDRLGAADPGFLRFNLDQVARYRTTGMGANPAAPFDQFSHARVLAGPADRFVTINNDTVYSVAQLDVSAGPLMLEVPDTSGRYYVLQFVGAWTDQFAYVGKRATGTAAGRDLLVAPDWDGDIPADVTVIRCPTTIATINGRWAVEGETDLPAVHALQDATRLVALNRDAAAPGIPSAHAIGASEALAFWEKYRRRCAAGPWRR